MKLIYVAGPYRASTEYGLTENIRHAEEATVRLWQEGWAVLCPHKNSAYLGGVVSDEVFIEGCLAMLRGCDAIYMLNGWQHSEGAKREMALAIELGMDIYYER